MAITRFTEENSFLSNFYFCKIEMEGIGYLSVENAYQAAKTLDVDERRAMSLMSPGQSKRRGSKVALREDWESIKMGIMEDLIRQKFQNAELREKLLATGDAELIEGNNWCDRFWGMCDGEGENHLGKILMKIRSEIANG